MIGEMDDTAVEKLFVDLDTSMSVISAAARNALTHGSNRDAALQSFAAELRRIADAITHTTKTRTVGFAPSKN